MPSTSDTSVLEIKRTLELTGERLRQTMSFIYSASRLDGNMIGWMPYQAYDTRHAQGRLIALWNNNDLVGFLMWSPNQLGEIRILQIWVRADARMILHGRALVNWLDHEAQKTGHQVIRLWCAVDLAANLFWPAVGFRYRCWRWGTGKKSRRHALWWRTITPRAVWLPQSEQPPTSAHASPTAPHSPRPLALAT